MTIGISDDENEKIRLTEDTAERAISQVRRVFFIVMKLYLSNNLTELLRFTRLDYRPS